jgi:hypothetical protein
MEYKVGQQIWVWHVDRHMGYEGTITYIGRRWVSFVHGYSGPSRFDKEDRWVDAGSYSSRERVWESRQACAEARKVDALWQQLSIKLGSMKPKATVEQIRQAAKTLGIDLD